MNAADHYAYRVTWSPEDSSFIGTAAEWPSLSWAAETPGEAFTGIHQLITDVLADMTAEGEKPPEPFADRKHSGSFQVRVPPELHKELVLNAAEQGVSLNRLISARLAGH